MLGAHNEGSAVQWEMLAVDPLLQLARREDPGWAGARHQAGRPRALPGAGGQNDGAGVHREEPVGACHLRPARTGPAGHHGAGPDVHAAGDGPLHPAAGVGRTAQEASQVAQAEAGVLAQAGGAARLVLPLHHHHASRAAGLQRGGCGQAGGTGADDQRVDRQNGAPHRLTAANRAANRAAMSAPQKKP